MHILVLHRVPDSFVRYGEAIDHEEHAVTYVSVPDRMGTLPRDVPARRLSRPGGEDTAAEVLAAVQGAEPPDLVIALSEYDLMAAARVREKLGVPGPRPDDVVLVREKVAMKAAAAAAGLRVPRFSTVIDALGTGTVSWAGRTILKPVDGASSEGVTDHPTVAGALGAARALGSAAGGYQIEEYVDGPIIHVDGMAGGGRVLTALASRYVGTCLAYADGRSLGSVQIDPGAEVLDWTARCLRAVGITEGPFHLEGIEDAGGLVFLEVGARFSGADVVGTFELATGVHLPSAQIRQILSGGSSLPAARTPGPQERYGWFVFPGHQLGSAFCRVRGESGLRDDPLVRRWVQRAADEPVSGSITYADDLVPLAGVIGPGSAADLERFLARLFATVTVEPRDDGPPAA